MNRGFSFVQLILSLAILLIIGAITVTTFYNARQSKNLDIVTDGLQFTLSKAKTDALAGRNGSNFGVFVASTSYTYFMGSSYNAADTSNKVNTIPNGWQLSTSTGISSSAIIFSRLTGAPQAAWTITVKNLNNPTQTRAITVGQQGDISVVK